MAIIKCKMCGGDLQLTANTSIAECEYCGSRQTVPLADNEKKLLLFERAEFLRRNCEFDKAAGVYETIVADFRQEAEAYWGLVLCKYGIEYVDDPATGKKVPTCHRSSFESVFKDSNFVQAQEYADVVARKVCREEAKVIEDIRKGILEVSAKENPYDIFICYKETDFNGKRTLDSVLAQDLYDALTAKGYRVFFSRISLEDKLGQAYEPYIFAALNSAKIMLAVGTEYEFFNAVWVKNEWSRFLKLMTQDKDKHLIPCYKGIDAYDMPEEFARLQAQDLDKMGAIQDILRGVEKLLQKPVEIIAAPTQGNIAPLLKRAGMFIEDGQWTQADGLCENVLNMDPECMQAYLYKLLAEMKLRSMEQLAACTQDYAQKDSFRKALRFADPETAEKLKQWLLQSRYARGCQIMDGASTEAAYRSAAEMFGKIPGYQDADTKKETCLEQADHLRKQMLYNNAVAAMNRKTISDYETAIRNFEALGNWQDAVTKLAVCKEEIRRMQAWEESEKKRKLREAELLQQRKQEVKKKIKKYGITAAVIALLIFLIWFVTAVIMPSIRYSQAITAMEEKDYRKAAVFFGELEDYRDSARKSKACWEQIIRHKTFVIDGTRFAALTESGAVTSASYSYYSLKEDLEDWQNIVSLCYASYDMYGLQKDGTVMTTDDDEAFINQWKNIVAIAASDSCIVGLKTDGTLVSTISNTRTNSLSGIVAFDCADWNVAAVKYDGTVTVTNGEYPGVDGWQDIIDVSVTKEYLAGLKKDGTVVTTSAKFDVSQWTDIVQVSASNTHIVGVKADGTVVATGSNVFNECNTTEWTDIVAIDTDANQTVGLQSDGSLVVAGNYLSQADAVEGLQDVQLLAAGENLSMAILKDGSVRLAGAMYGRLSETGLQISDIQDICIQTGFMSGSDVNIVKKDGTIASLFTGTVSDTWTNVQELCLDGSIEAALLKNGKVAFKDGTKLKTIEHYNGNVTTIDITNWEEITQIDTGDDFIVGLKSDGTVLASGNVDEYCSGISEWRNVTQISAAEYHVVGLKKDGTVVATGKNSDGKIKVEQWRDITAIATGNRFTVGLKADGAVVYAGVNSELDELDTWSDIIAICTGDTYVLGLKSDGTVVSAGESYDAYLDLSDFTDIKIP